MNIRQQQINLKIQIKSKHKNFFKILNINDRLTNDYIIESIFHDFNNDCKNHKMISTIINHNELNGKYANVIINYNNVNIVLCEIQELEKRCFYIDKYTYLKWIK